MSYQKYRDILASAERSPRLIVVMAALVFASSILFPFIALDDAKHIWQNPYVMSGSWANLKHMWEGPYYGLYIPTVYSVWMALAGITQSLGWANEFTVIRAPLFHFTNVMVHLFNVFLLWKLFAFWIERTWPRNENEENTHIFNIATLATAPFAFHPLQVEAVAWASGLKDSLMGFFCLIALTAISSQFSAAKEPKRKKNQGFELPHWISKRWLFWWFAGCVLAYLTKPSSIVLPLAAPIIAYGINSESFKKIKGLIWLPLIVAVLFAWITKSSQPDARLEFHLEIWQRPLVALASLGFYIFKIILPFELAPDYGLSPDKLLANGKVMLFYALGFAPFALVAVGWMKSRKGFLIGGLLFLLGFGPVLGLIPFEFQNLSTVADRYFYLFPAIGFGWCIAELSRTRPSIKEHAMVYLLPWFFFSIIQVDVWKDNDALFGHTVEINPKSYLALNNLGLQFMRRAEYDQAITQFDRALEAKPDYLSAISNLGVVYFKKNDFAKTIQHYESHLSKLPTAGPGAPAVYADMHFNLGAAYLNSKNMAAAEKNLRQAVIVNPDHFLAHYHFGRLLAALGRREEAKQELMQALRLQPNDTGVHAELNKLK